MNSLKDKMSSILLDKNGNFKNAFIRKLYKDSLNDEEKDLYLLINRETGHLSQDTSFIDRCFLLFNDMKELPKCKMCDNTTKLKTFKNGYAQYCSYFCMHNDKEYLNDCYKKMLDANVSLYGDAYYNNNEKSRQTRLNKYGKYASEEDINKRRQTRLEKYGDIGYNNKDKRIETCISKYGVESTNSVESIKHKQFSTRVKNGNRNEDSKVYPVFKKYRKFVDHKTEDVYNKYIDMINPCGYKRDYYLYQIDHKFSIFEAYRNGVHPLILVHPLNLRIITRKENTDKNIESSLTLNELLNDMGEYEKFDIHNFLNTVMCKIDSSIFDTYPKSILINTLVSSGFHEN